MSKAQIKKDECIGCGLCASVCPDGFEMVGAKAEVKSENAACLKQAADHCPVEAIILNNNNSG